MIGSCTHPNLTSAGWASVCRAVDEVLDRARRSEPTVLHIEGDAGTGKTTVCDYAAEQAEDLTVLRVLGMEWESRLPFAALSELLSPLRPLVEALPPDPRAAMSALLDHSWVAQDPFSAATGTLALLCRGAKHRPVAIVVDDAQWLDPGSASILAFVLRRLAGRRIGALVTAPPGERPRLHGRWPTLPLPDLTVEAAARLLRQHAPTAVSPATVQDLTDRTGGNPLALIEVARELTASQLAGTATLPDPLPLGPQGVAVFGRRLTGLPPATLACLTIVAAAGAAPAATILAALAAGGHGSEDLAPAEAVGLIRHRGGTMQFAHPLVRAAMFASVTGVERRRAHDLLAAAAVGDPERRAKHLGAAAIEPNEDLALALEGAGAVAARRADVAGAAATALRAAELTPDGAERPPRLLRAADALLVAGQVDASAAVLAQALAQPTSAAVRSEGLGLQALQMRLDPRGACSAAVLRCNLQELLEVDRPNAVVVGLLLSGLLISLGQHQEALKIAVRMQPLAAPETDLADLAGIQHRFAALVTGEPGDGRSLPTLAIDRLADRLRGPAAAVVVPTVAQLLSLTDRTGDAAAWCQRHLADAGRMGASCLAPLEETMLGQLLLDLGDTTRARACLDQATARCESTGQGGVTGFARATRALIAAYEGDRARCLDEGRLALEAAALTGQRLVEVHVHRALGLLELGDGHCRAAVHQLGRNEELMAADGPLHPRLACWEGDYVEALVGAGEPERARTALFRLRQTSDRTGSAWGRAVALRCEAQLDPCGSGDALREAIDLQADHPLEQGRSRLVLGEQLRRAGHVRAAHEQLSAAAELFQVCEARPWVEQAESRMRATGIRRVRGWEGELRLTEQEQRVALAVAEGATNKEAAAGLFLSQKTVEYHLAKVFRKLRVTNRTQLAAVIRSDISA